jgi:hypothetical protein
MMTIEDGGAMNKEPMTMQTDTQPVDLRDWGYAPGYYSIKCRDCTEAGLRDCAAKHSWRCKDCATKAREASLIAAKSTAAQPVDLVADLHKAVLYYAAQDWPDEDTELLTTAADEIEALRARCEAPYQSRVAVWMSQTFSDDVRKDAIERAMRFLEEANELCQSIGLTAEQASVVTGYVYGRPVGEPSQEVGGSMVTLAALCDTIGLDMDDAGEVELSRINTPEMRAKIAAKQVSKRLFGMTGPAMEFDRAALGDAK